MNFTFSDEQSAVQITARKYLADHYRFEGRNIDIAENRAPARHWQQFCDLGWVGMALPESAGGYGGSLQDLMPVAMELGRALVVEPWQANAVLAGTVLAKMGNDAGQQLLQDMMNGVRQLALAHAEPESRFNLQPQTCVAEEVDGGYRLSGKKVLVYNAQHATDLLVTARMADGVAVFHLPPMSEGMQRCDYRTVDGFAASDIDFNDLILPSSSLLGADAGAAVAIAIQRAAFSLCAEAVGIMEAVLEKTVEYVKTRQQFGVAIGSFQVIQHRLAEMFIEVEQSRSMLYRWAIEGESSESIWHAAKARIGIACRMVGEQAVQLHGGMGISHELDIGHYFKRLSCIAFLYGDVDYHLNCMQAH